MASVAHSITASEQYKLNRICYFHSFGMFIASMGFNYSEIIYD